MEYRVRTVMRLYKDSEKDAIKHIKESDNRRKNYGLIANREWGQKENYDLCLNTQMGNEKTADIIVHFVKNRTK